MIDEEGWEESWMTEWTSSEWVKTEQTILLAFCHADNVL